jgi:hypothetical protein
MTPDEFRLIAGLGAALWGVAALGILIIQAIAWPNSPTKWAAMFAVATVAILCNRLSLSYLFDLSLGTNEQGVGVFFGGGLLWMGFFVLCWHQNLGLYGQRFREICEHWTQRLQRWSQRAQQTWHRLFR